MTRASWLVLLFALAARAQSPAAKTENDARNLRGIWQATGNAHLNLENKGVIVDPANGKIPYKAEARAAVELNFKDRAKLDPVLACFQPALPRATLLPEPFQIFQSTSQNADRVTIVYQHVHAYRVIFTDGRPHYDEGIEFYMGDSRGHWDGNTLVIDATNFKPETWLDGTGHFHSSKLHVIERYTRTDPNIMRYEATIEDPEVLERPFTIRVNLTRHTEPNFQLVEHECERDAKGVYRHPAPFLKGLVP
ncbi:MAG: hypothetical protein ABI995_09240 [Acidobacteriota bacterium]